MIRCEAIETFTLGRFDELTDIERAGVDEKGKLNAGDKFTCPKDLADYLLGENRFNKAFVKVIEIIPEKKEPKTENVEVKIEFDTEKAINKVREIENNGGTIEEAKQEVSKIINDTTKIKEVIKPKTTKKKISKKRIEY